MFELTDKELERYDSMVPKANYSCLEAFLRTVSDKDLVEISNNSAFDKEGKLEPFSEFYLYTILGKIFVGEYGDLDKLKVMSFRSVDYKNLLPLFFASTTNELISRYKDDWRIKVVRKLIPSQISLYKNIDYVPTDEERSG